ncbi:DegV family protein [Sporosarcina sp. CAU 1771]
MSKKIAWITDTAAQLDDAFIKLNNVHILPLSVVFPDGSYKESIELTQKEFYEKLQKTKVSPKTSQPAIGERLALYDQLQLEGYDVVVALHVSSGISGTFESAQAASEMTELKVYTIDSKIGSFPMTKMIEHGNELFAKGQNPEEVIASITDMASKSRLSFIPASLNQLHKSGRVSGTQTFISNLLNIKVVISFENGKPLLKQKVRTNDRAKNNVTSLLRKDMLVGKVPEVAVIHCNNSTDATIWQSELLKEFPNLKVHVESLSVCVGVHAGEGTTGLSWVTY